MGPNRRRPLQFESLEGKLLLSVAPVSRGAAPSSRELVPQSQSQSQTAPTLDGSLVGARSALASLDRDRDGSTVSYTFSGKVAGMGLVRATYVQSSRSSGGPVHGSITLTNKAGTVRLTFAEKDRVTDVTAPTYSTATYHYQVATATNAYAGLQGGGLFTLGSTILRPNAVTLDIHGLSRVGTVS